MAIRECYEVAPDQQPSNLPTYVYDSPIDAHRRATALAAEFQVTYKVSRCVWYTGRSEPQRTTVMTIPPQPSWVTEEFLKDPGNPKFFSEVSNRVARNSPDPYAENPYAQPHSYPVGPPQEPPIRQQPFPPKAPQTPDMSRYSTAQPKAQATPTQAPVPQTNPLERPFKPCFSCRGKS